MPKKSTSGTQKHLAAENEDLRARLDEADETLRAIRSGEVDALVVSGAGGEQIFTLKGADHSYRMLIENMSEGALTVTAEGLILYANQCFAAMLKTPLEKVIGSTIHNWFAPDSQPVLQSLLRIGVTEKRREQFVLTAGDGTLLPISLSVSNPNINEMPDSFCLVATNLTDLKKNEEIVVSEKLAQELLEDSNQSRLALLSVIEDQKLAEDELRLSEEKFRTITEFSADAIFITDPTGKYVYVNQASSDLLGYTSDTLLTMTIADLSSPDEGVQDIEEFQKLIKGGSIYTEILLKRADSTFVPVDLNAIVLPNGLIYGSCRDISERKKAEEALRESKMVLEEIINTIPVRVFWKDKNLFFLGCNAEFAHDAGFKDPKDIIGKDDFQMVWRDQAELYRNDDRQVIESGISKILIEEPQTTPEGKTITNLTNKVPLRNSQGEISGLLGTYMDITSIKKTEEDLHRTTQLLKETGRIAKIGGWEFDAKTKEETWTDEVAKIHDLDPNEPTNVEKGLSFYKPGSKEKIEKAIDEAIKNGKSFDLELELISAKGKHKWVRSIGNPIKEKNKIVKIAGSFQDITDIKVAAEELKKYRENLEEIIKERTADLEKKNLDLKRLNKLFVGREFRIKELRDKIKDLKKNEAK